MKTKNKHRLTRAAALIVSLAFVAPSCKKDKPEPVVPEIGNGLRVFVVNEGPFLSGNASVSAYSPYSKQVDADYFGTQNQGAKLGDVAQSILRHKEEYFIVVNNSGTIVVCDRSFRKTGEISGLSSPRFIQVVNGDEAYVSDFKSNAVTRVNLATRSVIGKIPLPGFTEGMTMHDNYVYVCNSASEYLYRINTQQHQVTDSIRVGYGGSSVVVDRNKRIWVLAGGNFFTGTPGSLSSIDPVTLEVEKNLVFEAGVFPSRLCLNASSDTLYFLADGVRRMSVSENALPGAPFVPSESMSFYALEVNPHTHQVFVSDAIDYVQQSSVIVFSPQGQRVTEFKAGVVATDFYFE